MRRTRLGPIILIALVAAPLAWAQEPAEADAQPAWATCPVFEMDGVGQVCEREPGLYEVFGANGRSLGFTHGPDPRCETCPQAQDTVTAAGSTAVACMTGHPGEHHVHVIYARAQNDVDRYAALAPVLRDLVGQMNALVDDAALATGDSLKIRVLCSGGAIVVDNAVLRTRMAFADWSTIMQDLEALGYDDPHKKYLVYYDDAGACACAGVGNFYNDATDGPGNLNNGHGTLMFAISFDAADVRTLLHELGHTMGAVLHGAPRSSGAAHCTDGRDTMCYNDGGPRSGDCQPDFTCSAVCSVEVFDCNKDTYCHANPAPGSYLDTHWQVCHRDNYFLRFPGDLAPIMTTLACTPAPSYPDELVTCAFSATDDEPVFYEIEWGDGATERVPATGTVAAGPIQTASHVYTSEGARTVRVRATDSAASPRTSHDATLAHTVHPTNVPPAVTIVSCTSAPSEGQLVTCRFHATDAQPVSYQVSWGDGSGTTRVPAAGTVSPTTWQTVTHTYSRGGAFTFSVSATDTGRPALVGAASRVLDVAEVNTRPTLRHFSCSPTTLRPGETLTCSVAADDDTTLRYVIDWGDGTTSSVPASGCIEPGPTRTATHVYAVEGDLTVSGVAVDCFTDPASSGTISRAIRVLADTTPPTLVVTEPVNGMIYFGCGSEMSKGTGPALFVQRGCARAEATDASGVARVEVLRGTTILASDTTAPYELEFDVPLFGQGLEWMVRATDARGFSTTRHFNGDAVGGTA